MDDSISFGEVEETQPDSHQRPDQNYHYAVVPVGRIVPEDLPIYVDIDSALDIETHALENTEIELGGVLLGGQYVDDQGRPFVLVRDSVRAEDYEATKGSFKFTHETWEKISRQMDQFPAGTSIVGWYHTHPDWGIFLSGMDMFICNGFFNRPLDVALVVDPCNDDRGWFHWHTTENGKEKRQNSGFYLFGSRFRQQELQLTAEAMLSPKGNDMVTQQRFTATPGTAPVVHVHQPDQRWMGTAVLSMMFMQTLLLLLFGTYFLTRFDSTTSRESTAYQSVIDKLLPEDNSTLTREEKIAKLMDNERRSLEYEAKIETLSLGGQSMLKKLANLSDEHANLQVNYEKMKKDSAAQQAELKLLKEKSPEAGSATSLLAFWTNWVNIAVVCVLGAVLFGGGMLAAGYWKSEWEEEVQEPARPQTSINFPSSSDSDSDHD